jgi:diguanylate cyclase (GGDEF)-like protein
VSKGEVLNKIGLVYEKLNKKEDALGFYKESLHVLENCENRFYQIDTLISLGSYYIKQKEFDTGINYLNRALDYAEEMNADKKVYSAHLLLAECYEGCGNFAEALHHYKRFHEIERKVIADNLEEKLKVVVIEYKLDKLQKESEIYRLRNIELKQKNEIIESKIMQLAVSNERLNNEINKSVELQAHLEQANKKLEHLSYVDELTEIPNRRIFNKVIKEQWNRCLQEAIPLSVILIDIDFFKNYNDNYGHLQGDECLWKVAKALEGSIKNSFDFIGRFGGEEFGIILPNTGYEYSILIAEQMRISVESLRIIHEYSSVSHYITISLGVTTKLPKKHMHYNELINASDKQLYKAKQEGRNRVCAMYL